MQAYIYPSRPCAPHLKTQSFCRRPRRRRQCRKNLLTHLTLGTPIHLGFHLRHLLPPLLHGCQHELRDGVEYVRYGRPHDVVWDRDLVYPISERFP